MTKVKVRLAKTSELKVVQDLNHELFISDNRHFGELSLNWPYEEQGKTYFQSMISGEAGVCYVAEIAGEIVGYLAGRMRSGSKVYPGKRAELDNMFIMEEYRSQGVGKQLVEEFFKWCKGRGAEYVMVNAYSPNTRALAFYEKQGFENYSVNLWKKIK